MKIRWEGIREVIDANRGLFTLLNVGGVISWYVIWLVVEEKPISLKSSEKFAESFVLLLSAYFFVMALVPWAFQSRGVEKKQARLRAMQKERFSLLPRFSPEGHEVLLGRQSIYRAIMASLERAKQALAEDKDQKGVVRLVAKFLLCSPALDYPERVENLADGYQVWGEEFGNEINELISKDNANIDFTFLPENSGAGYHPLDDFLQVLASYCESRRSGVSTVHFDTIYRQILQATRNAITRLETQERTSTRVKIRRYVHNIPFQIILFRTEAAKEAVVSFAGHELLEDVASREPIGFFTSDPYVVQQLEKVYDEYTAEKRRRPFTPLHTHDVLQRQKDQSNHVLDNYLKLDLKIFVSPGSFSPFYGNSSKFTSWVLTKVLDTQTSVLDIGAGTGVQALVAERVLAGPVEGGGNNRRIVAVECSPGAYTNLEKNIQENSSKILPIRGVMVARTDKRNYPISAWKMIAKEEKEQLKNQLEKDKQARNGVGDFIDLANDEEIINGEIHCAKEDGESTGEKSPIDAERFDVVVADLPFCDALPHSLEERAFLDMGHREHKTLFCAIRNGKWLKDEGIVITSLSSLGGSNDVIAFERLIDDHDLLVLQKFYFYEARYMWIVYALKRKTNLSTYFEIQSNGLSDKYWQERLHVHMGVDPTVVSPGVI